MADNMEGVVATGEETPTVNIKEKTVSGQLQCSYI